MSNNPNDLMHALIAKLYSIITGDDDIIGIARNKFVSWMLPGIPFSRRDFRFLRGYSGNSAEDVQERYQQGFALSKMLDYIPDVNNQFVETGNNLEQSVFMTTQDTISAVYKDVLKYSRVLDNKISKKEEEKIQKFRNLLSMTKEETDLYTDEVRTITVPGPMTIAYTTKRQEYEEDLDEYLSLQADAQSASGNDPEAKRRVHLWGRKEKFLRQKVKSSHDAWVSLGYKNKYDEINAYIDQVTGNSMVLYKRDLMTKLESSLQTTPDGAQYYNTYLIPANFANHDNWSEFNYSELDYDSHYNKKTSTTKAGGRFSFGLFSVGGSGSGSKMTETTDIKTTGFSSTFEVIQIPIIRPWFEPGFFFMRSWTLDETWDLTYDKKVSDGSANPIGRLVAYPTTALFVRNVRFAFNEWEQHRRVAEKSRSGGASAGWGPFRVSGSHSRGSIKRDVEARYERGGLQIDGIQLIGFINNLIPKSPNLNPKIKPKDLVGGA